jgi:hypothetical protein
MSSGGTFHWKERGMSQGHEADNSPHLIPRICGALPPCPIRLHSINRDNHTLSQKSYSNNVDEKYLPPCMINNASIT